MEAIDRVWHWRRARRSLSSHTAK
jgi:hypothetical protein